MHLPNRVRTSSPLWFWAARDTTLLLDRVRRWRGGEGRYLTKAPKSGVIDPTWKLAIVIPRSDNATIACRSIFKTRRPACVLVPTDLVAYVGQNLDGSFDTEMVAAIKKAINIV